MGKNDGCPLKLTSGLFSKGSIMDYVITFFVKNWRFSFVCALLLFLAGVASLFLLQRESFPPVNFATVKINTVFPGASPEEVHDQVTQYIEDELRGIDGIKDVRSTSQNDLSDITIRIDIDGQDVSQVVDDIQRAVQRATVKLPEEVLEDPVVTEIKATEIPIFEMALIGPNEGRLRDIWVEKLQDKLEDVKGVSSVQLMGYTDRELQVLLNPLKMNELYVGLSDVVSVLQNQIRNVPSGYVENSENAQLVRVIGKTIDPDQLLQLPIRSAISGKTVLLKEVAAVHEGFARPQILSSLNGESATLLSVIKLGQADAVTVVRLIKPLLEQFKKDLPPDLKIEVFNNESQRIENRLAIVEFNAVSGMIIVLIVLMFILPGRIGLVSSLSLPICALGSIVFMIVFGANFNIITMIALVICLGNLVDNSVVISEYYARLRDQGVDAQTAAVNASKQFWVPFTASTITIVAAFLPMLVTTGVLGQFIRWIPIIVTVSLTLSLVEALTLLPARLQFVHPKSKKQNVTQNVSWLDRMELKFGEFIAWTLKHRILTVLSVALLFVLGVGVTAVFNRFELFPAEGVEYYVGRYELPPQTSLQKTEKIGRDLAVQVQNVLGKDIAQFVVVKAGIQQMGPDDQRSMRGESLGLLQIAIHPDVVANLDIGQTLAQLATIPKPEGVTKLSFETMDQGPPIGKPLTITLRSLNYEPLNDFRTSLLKRLQVLPGIVGLEDDEMQTGVEYQFYPDPKNSLMFRLDAQTLGFYFRTAISGLAVAKLNEHQREYDLVVKFAPEFTQSAQGFDGSTFVTSDGYQVLFSDIGRVEVNPAPKIHKNYNFQRAITITSEVDLHVSTSVALNQQARDFVKEMQKEFPEVSVVFGGEEESTNESLASLGLALLLAIFGIFATLVFTFNSFREPLLVLSTIPLGLVGVFFGFAVDQRPLSFLAFIGVIGLSGVVINSAIILVDYIRELRLERLDLSLEEILVKASVERLRAVLATGLTTVVGLMPTAFGLGGYDSILVPITFALSCGMIVGTILTLIWVPVAYLVMTGKQRRFKA